MNNKKNSPLLNIFKNKTSRIFFLLFCLCVMLLDISMVVTTFQNRKSKYYNFYSNQRIFYIQLKRNTENGEIIEMNDFVTVGAYFYYGNGQFDYFDSERLYFSTGFVSPLYYFVCGKQYTAVSFKIIDSSNNRSIIDETFPTEIKDFGTYELYFEKGWPYVYSKSSWTEPSITFREFTDLFIKQHNSELKNDYFRGIYSYPNIYNSFLYILSHEEELKAIDRVDCDLDGINAYEQWKSLEKEFVNEGVDYV